MIIPDVKYTAILDLWRSISLVAITLYFIKLKI
ncbi:MAG: hypothetical protein ACI9LG_001002 [Moritella dasanensis]|jgi:hypothetical protein